jgi:hypothetical protein
MDSYNFEIPIMLDDEDCCADCGRVLENGKNTICEYCNKRYQQEAILMEEIEEPFSDEEDHAYYPTRALIEKIEEEY